MPTTYTITPRLEQRDYKIEVQTDDGYGVTVLAFDTEVDAALWIAADQDRNRSPSPAVAKSGEKRTAVADS